MGGRIGCAEVKPTEDFSAILQLKVSCALAMRLSLTGETPGEYQCAALPEPIPIHPACSGKEETL